MDPSKVYQELRDDPTSLLPERVIVFEIANIITDFFNAVTRVDGLEFMAEYETDFAPDKDFAMKDTRKGKTGQDRTDKTVGGRFYLAMPDVQAFKIAKPMGPLGKGQPLATGFAPSHTYLHNFTPCVLGGRSTVFAKRQVRFWQEENTRTPDRPVRTEVELWYRQSPDRRPPRYPRLYRLGHGNRRNGSSRSYHPRR